MFKKYQIILLLALIVLLGTTACNAPFENSEWETHLPGGETICSGGSPYAFFTRQSESKNLLIFFQPGGGCPANLPCELENNQLFDPTVYIQGDKSTKSGMMWDQDHPDTQGGIFDLDDDRNPFRDYNMLYIPYCTADAHIGDNVNEGINHKGFVNSTAALAWAYSQFDELDHIFIAGSSAGAISAPFYAGFVAEQYPNAQIATLGDCSGGYHFPMTDTLENWGTLSLMQNELGVTDIPIENLNFETSTIVNGARYPDVIFTQFNVDEDKVEQQFVSMSSGLDTPLAEMLAANHADIRAEIDNFRTYTVNDTYHMILPTKRFYKESVNGVLFYKWVTDLTNGVDVEDVAP